jgi:hypothetical protein
MRNGNRELLPPQMMTRLKLPAVLVCLVDDGLSERDPAVVIRHLREVIAKGFEGVELWLMTRFGTS